MRADTSGLMDAAAQVEHIGPDDSTLSALDGARVAILRYEMTEGQQVNVRLAEE
jgi:hypothetical protein